MTTRPQAKVIAHSVNPYGNRLLTFRCRYPKFIHGEFMTHRVLSRNASSSRAVPTERLIEEARSDELRATFVHWGMNQRGMQAAGELDEIDMRKAKGWWAHAAGLAADCAQGLLDLNTHKQIVNRLLEPFTHINVLATGTEWDNFFGLRLHRDAQPEMRALTEEMWRAFNESEPVSLRTGEWHLPYADDDQTRDEVVRYVCRTTDLTKDVDLALIKVSVARSARVSYENFETGKRSTAEKDIEFYSTKLHLPELAADPEPGAPIHASPAEHQGQADELVARASLCVGYVNETLDINNVASSPVYVDRWMYGHQHGNLTGYRQFRKLLRGEAKAPLPEGYA